MSGSHPWGQAPPLNRIELSEIVGRQVWQSNLRFFNEELPRELLRKKNYLTPRPNKALQLTTR